MLLFLGIEDIEMKIYNTAYLIQNVGTTSCSDVKCGARGVWREMEFMRRDRYEICDRFRDQNQDFNISVLRVGYTRLITY